LHGCYPTRAKDTFEAGWGLAFVNRDAELDGRRAGPIWLNQEPVARLVAESIKSGSADGRYELYAWVVMPNHVHVLLGAHRSLGEITRLLKGRTARETNLLLGRTGRPFWQNESYDHCVRSRREFHQIKRYIERNPVKAGFVIRESDWRWSSAYEQASSPM
jgi:REP element-mobilizing transposase RayT